MITCVKAYPKDKRPAEIVDAFGVVHKLTVASYWILDASRKLYKITPRPGEMVFTGGEFDLFQVELFELPAAGDPLVYLRGEPMRVPSDSIITLEPQEESCG